MRDYAQGNQTGMIEWREEYVIKVHLNRPQRGADK